MPYFAYNSKNVFYSELGSGEPLLLLHGNTASSLMFGEMAADYSDSYRVILIDFLGHGKSDRLDVFPTDLWYDEALQVIAFLREKKYENVNVIGSSGGALVAINLALEAPELIKSVVADSFEGERPLKEFTENVVAERERSKGDAGAVMFYKAMQGEDWESVVDNDTQAIYRHSREIGRFFHKPVEELRARIMLTGSKEDEFLAAVSPDYYGQVYGELLRKIGHGEMLLFEHGGHPAMLSNRDEFAEKSKAFMNA